MKARLHRLVIMLALVLGINQASAQQARFFRVSGPTKTTIVAFNPDGTLVWSNAQSGATYTIQTVALLPGGSNWVDYVQLPTTNTVNTNLLIVFDPPAGMTFIPAGSFEIGDTLDGESDAIPTNVYVSGFYMDTHLVTYSLWQTVYSFATSHGYSFDDSGSAQTNNQPVEPVELVGWYDAARWSNARSQQAGLTPVYYMDAGFTQVYTNGDPDTVYPNWGADGYRLPTEAEWEKAARGGLSGQRFPWGNTISESQANYFADPNPPNTNGYTYDLGPYTGYNTNYESGAYPWTSPVGHFAANNYGLHDMAGNLFEWCWDWYAGPPYQAGSPYLGGTDPPGPSGLSTGFSNRVVRGGGWNGSAYGARCAFRFGNGPSDSNSDLGFRCVRGL